MKMSVIGLVAALGFAGSPLAAMAQEVTYSLSPGGSVQFGDVPYSKPTIHPNEIVNPNPLAAYRPPAYSYTTYPTFDINEVDTRRLVPARPARQAAARQGSTEVVAKQSTGRQTAAKRGGQAKASRVVARASGPKARRVASLDRPGRLR